MDILQKGKSQICRIIQQLNTFLQIVDGIPTSSQKLAEIILK